MKRFKGISLAAAVLLPAGLIAQDFYYTISDGEVTITEYTGNETEELAIPATIEDLPVTTIGKWAIGGPMKSVSIGSNVTTIEATPFVYCENLEVINVDPSNPNFSSVDGVLFDKAVTHLIQFPENWGISYIIPDSVTSIGDWAFSDCFVFTVTIPDSVTSIGDWAFNDSYLKTVTIGSNVATIGIEAFGWCTFMTGVYFLGEPPTLGLDVFDETGPSLILYYLEGTPGWEAEFGGVPTQSFTRWGPYLITGGYCDTSDFMGWLYVAYAPWVWCQKTQCWYYIREEVAVADRGWLYAPDLAAMEVYPATGYAWSYKMSKWIYIEPSGSGWFYML